MIRYINDGVTLRSLVIGILLILVNLFLTTQKFSYTPFWSEGLSIFYSVIFLFFMMILANLTLQRLAPAVALKQGELLVVYVMLCMATAIGGYDMVQALPSIMTRPFWFATPENEWQELFWRYIPSWLSVRDERALRGFYEGDSTFYTARNIQIWLGPVFWWSVFIIGLVCTTLLLNVVMRRQWIDREKLSYPIIQLPFQMSKTTQRPNLFGEKLFWVGLSIAAAIYTIKSLHMLYPVIPDIPFVRNFHQYDLGNLLTQKPWNAIGWTPITILPFMVGLCFFIPLDMLLSVWFFYLLKKAELILGNALGWRAGVYYTYNTAFMRWQITGAYLGIWLFVLWASKSHMKEVAKQVFGVESRRSKPTDNSFVKPYVTERRRYRTIFLWLLGSFFFLILFSHRAGMSIWVATLFLLIHIFFLSFTITRIRAQLGTPVHDLAFSGPSEILINIFGTRRLGAKNLTMFSMYSFFSQFYRFLPTPHQLEGLKLADRAQINVTKLMLVMVLAIVIAPMASFFCSLHFGYQIPSTPCGFISVNAYRFLENWLYHPKATDYTALAFTGIGLGSILLLTLLRMRFLWWPLHPLALPFASGVIINHLWFSIFISWLAKWVILKYGGLRAHRCAVPFFLGLILGEFIPGGISSIIGQIAGRPMYMFWY